jgi:hypothetical protein
MATNYANNDVLPVDLEAHEELLHKYQVSNTVKIFLSYSAICTSEPDEVLAGH